MRKGKVIDAGDEKKIVNCENAFSIFRDLPGTPAYWRKFRNEMLARLEQLGPFDFFFTLSSAEMRWNEVLAAVLQKKGHKVTVRTDDDKVKKKSKGPSCSSLANISFLNFLQ